MATEALTTAEVVEGVGAGKTEPDRPGTVLRHSRLAAPS